MLRASRTALAMPGVPSSPRPKVRRKKPLCARSGNPAPLEFNGVGSDVERLQGLIDHDPVAYHGAAKHRIADEVHGDDEVGAEARHTATGTGLTRAPSKSQRPFNFTGSKMPGRA